MMERTYGRRKPGIPMTLSDSLNDAVSQTEYLSSSSSNFRDGYPRNGDVGRAKRARNGEAFASTSLDTQEFGELVEHEDEVRFALEGLRKGQSLRIRRDSLSSLLSICASPHQRRSLSAQGFSHSIINALLVLSLDDIPSNLAAATLFFVLTADGLDEHFMESPRCIWFLIKLLKPVMVTSAKEKPQNIRFKLLPLLKDVDAARDPAKINDPSSSDILSRVQELIVNCKEMRMNDSCKTEITRPELSTKLVALLAMERACLSNISFDDASGSVEKTGVIFKEKLRELGGLDAVLEVVMDCHAVMERWVEYDALSVQEKKDNLYKQSLLLLLKCLKIMENAKLHSIDNQNHLLKFKKSLGSHESQMSFTELMISVIKMLSGLHLRGGFPSPNRKNVNPFYSNGGKCDSISGSDRKVANEVVTISSDTHSTVGSVSTRNESVFQRSQSIIHLDFSPTSMSGNEPTTSKTRVGSTISGSSAGRLGIGDSQEELSNRDCSISLQPSSCTNDIDEACLCLLSDCLLAAVNVLMDFTYDNAVGCRQVGGCRGLESIAELIARHFSSFSRTPLFSEMENTGSSHQKKDLTFEELKFLVSISGLLVNLVQNDGVNRSRLASASVPITKPEGLQESEQKMIPLLCSIFLTSERLLEDDEEALLDRKKEIERILVAEHAALVLAYLSTESISIRNSIKDYLPKRNLAIIVPSLKRYVAILMIAHMISREKHKALMELIESCKLP